MKHSVALIAVALVAGMALPGSAEARSLKEALVPENQALDNPILQGALRPLGNAIGSQVANQIPSLSTSAGYTYEWNSELEVLERSAKTFGPLFSERAVTLGRNKFNVNVSYSYIKFDTFNGEEISSLTNKIEKAYVPETGTVEFFGLNRQDNRTGLSVGDAVTVDLDLEAQLFDFSFTYGVLDSLDVNIDIPVLRTYVHSTVNEALPDPRCLGIDPACNQELEQVGPTNLGPYESRASALGIGDIHFRAKWAPVTKPFRMAGLLDLAVPTGDPADFQGTGTTRLATSLIASKDLFSIFELHTQGGVQFNCDDVNTSQARYAAGVTAQLASFMAVTVDFLGRSEFGAQGRIPNAGRLPAVRNIDGVDTLTQPVAELDDIDQYKGAPLFIDIKRNDILDLAVGGRFAIGDRAMIIANFLIPLNRDGLRADFIPTVGAEINF